MWEPRRHVVVFECRSVPRQNVVTLLIPTNIWSEQETLDSCPDEE